MSQAPAKREWSPSHQKAWGQPSAFFSERTREAEHEIEWLSIDCIHAHYRTWAFRAGFQAVSLQKLENDLKKICGGRMEVVNGHRLYPRYVMDKDESQKPEEPIKPQSSVTKLRVLGRVQTKMAITFSGETCEAGLILPWMQATDDEAETIKRLVESSREAHRSYLVVFWDGKRRIIAGNNVERIE